MADINLKGMGVALITPFKDDESVDYDALSKLVDYQVQNGTDYLVVLGTTAETPTLTEEEKKNYQKVADAFTEIYKYCDIVVVDIGKYGFAVLQYIRIQDGFEQTTIYTNSKHLFHDLWREWLPGERRFCGSAGLP